MKCFGNIRQTPWFLNSLGIAMTLVANVIISLFSFVSFFFHLLLSLSLFARLIITNWWNSVFGISQSVFFFTFWASTKMVFGNLNSAYPKSFKTIFSVFTLLIIHCADLTIHFSIFQYFQFGFKYKRVCFFEFLNLRRQFSLLFVVRSEILVADFVPYIFLQFFISVVF